jgi:hypothetical protein
MQTEQIVSLLVTERDKLNNAIEALGGGDKRKVPARVNGASDSEGLIPKAKRHISAASRRKMALGQKKRWAAVKAAKGSAKNN